MDHKFEIELTGFEIAVTAGLLGYESVFGISDELTSADTILVKEVREAVGHLESLRLLGYGLDGTLYISDGLRRIIECLCSASAVSLVSTNIGVSRKRTSVYVTCSEENAAVLQRIGKNLYHLSLVSTDDIGSVLPAEIMSAESGSISERILLEEAYEVKERIGFFDMDGAEDFLEKRVKKKESIPIICEVLSGNCSFISILVCKKGEKLYKSAYSSFTAVVNNEAISVIADENDVLCIDTCDPAELVSKLACNMEIKEKRGAE